MRHATTYRTHGWPTEASRPPRVPATTRPSLGRRIRHLLDLPPGPELPPRSGTA
jgi:hypothetical protein